MSKPRHVPCSMEEYHARDEWSRSQICTLRDRRKGPRWFYGAYISDPPLWSDTPSAAKDFGTIVHELLSSPGSIDEKVVEIPVDTFKTTTGKKATTWRSTKDFGEWSKEHADKIQLTADELATARAMVREAYRHDTARELLAHAMHYEHTLVWEDPETGLILRSRSDIICGMERNIVPVDAKSTWTVDENQFSYQVRDYKLHVQAAMQKRPWKLLGYPVPTFAFLALSKEPPYSCRVYELEADAIAAGEDELESMLKELRRRLDQHKQRGQNDDYAWRDERDIEVTKVDLPRNYYR